VTYQELSLSSIISEAVLNSLPISCGLCRQLVNGVDNTEMACGVAGKSSYYKYNSINKIMIIMYTLHSRISPAAVRSCSMVYCGSINHAVVISQPYRRGYISTSMPHFGGLRLARSSGSTSLERLFHFKICSRYDRPLPIQLDGTW